MMSVVLNLAIAVASVLAWISVVQGRGDDHNLMTHGLGSLKYYTVQSNLFSGATSLVYAGGLLLAGEAVPAWILALKLTGAAVVMVTFVTVVVFLGPTKGWRPMFMAGNLWLHLILPLAAALDVCLFVPVGSLPFAATLAAVAFTVLYAVGYVDKVRRFGSERDGKVYDFYGFTRWGEDKIMVVATVMLALTWVLAVALWLANRALGLG